MTYDVKKIRDDFPILSRQVYGRKLVYLDNAATTQKPLQVLDAMREEYLNVNANVHRGVHYLSQQATDLHEAAREKVRQFINARSTTEVVFTRGTTESINLVAQTFCETFMKEGDEVLVTDMEHHSNIVPWQLQAQKRGIVVRHLPITERGELLLDGLGMANDSLDGIEAHRNQGAGHCCLDGIEAHRNQGAAVVVGRDSIAAENKTAESKTAESSAAGSNATKSNATPLLNERTRLVALCHVSNVLGTVNPVDEIVKKCHERGIPVLIDAAQSAPHLPLDVQAMDCDFLCFSGHKMYGPTGIGVLYGKEEWLEKLPPYQGGGEMIDQVSWQHTTFERPPLKFEAGTPDYVATHGLATAIDYLCAIGLDNIQAHEQALTRYCTEQLKTIDGMRIFGEAEHKDAVVSFLVGNIHHLDMGTLLDRLGIAVRTGHHCAHPLMQRLGVTGTVRASFGLYNTKEEIDVLVEGIRRVSRMF